MDYEDNDFQSQSFQLAVEENNKFSSGSHSYSLPKFDLDDNLQVHLRFDSLVESDVLLGIQSQEENQWIEDFSRESSGLEFSSSAAESCSISRRNNIWSEATSSESVDLLLKSVGQDEIIMEQAIIEESNVCDGFDSSTNQMNPNLHQDGFSPSKMGNDTYVNSMPKLDDPVEQFSVLDIDVVDQLPQIDSTSQNNEGKRSADGDSRVMTSIEEEKYMISFSNEMGPKEDMNLVDKSDENKPVDGSETPESMQVNPIIASVQGFVNAGELNSDVQQRPEGLETGVAETVGDPEVLTGVMNSQTCENHLVDTDGNNLGNVSNLVEKIDPMPQITEVSSAAISTQDTIQISPYENVSPKDTNMADQFIGNSEEASCLITEGENISVAHSPDIRAGDTESLSIQIMNTPDRTMQGCSNSNAAFVAEDLSVNAGHQIDGEISSSNTGRLPVEEKTVAQVQVKDNSSDHVEHSADTSAGSIGVLSVQTIDTSDQTIQGFSNGASVAEKEGLSENAAHQLDCGISSNNTGRLPVEEKTVAQGQVKDNINDHVVHSADISAEATEGLSMQTMHISDQTIHGCSDSSSVAEKELSENAAHQLDGAISSNAGRLAEEKGVFQGQGYENSNDHVEHSSSLLMEVGPSIDIPRESQKLENLNDSNGGLEVHSAEACGSSSVLVESLERCDRVSVETEPSFVRLCCPDSSAQKENEKSPSDSESTEVGPEAANVALDTILDGAHQLVLRSNIAEHESVQHKEDLGLPSNVDNFSLLVEQEETVTRVSILDAKDSSQVSNEWPTSTESEHGEVCDISRRMLAETVGRFSSSMEVCGKVCENEPKSNVVNIDAQQQHPEQLEGCSNIQTVAMNEKEGAEVGKKYNEEVPIPVEGLSASHASPKHSSPASLRESSLDTGIKDLEDNEPCEANNVMEIAPASLEGAVSSQTLTHSLPPSIEGSPSDITLRKVVDEASESNNGSRSPLISVQGVSLNGCEGTIWPAALSECDAEGHVLEPEINSPNSVEPNCGSPTIISCSEASQSEKDHRESTESLDNVDFDALEQEANKNRQSISEHKNDAFEDDRSFTFKVSSLVDSSKKETVGGWKPFPNIQAYQIPQDVETGTSTSRYSEIDPMLEDTSHVSPRISGEAIASESVVCSPEEKTRPVTANIAERQTAEEGKPQNDELIHGGKEQQEGVRSLDPNTTVPNIIDQVENVDVSTVRDPKEIIAAEVDRRSSFEVNSIAKSSEKQTCYSWKPVHSVQPHEFPQTVGVSSPSLPFIHQIDAKTLQEISHECRPQTSGAKSTRQSHKGSAEDKRRLLSGKAADKENEKGKVQKETFSKKHAKASGNNFICASPAALTQAVQAAGMPAVGFSEGSGMKSCDVSALQTSDLPDLNSSASSSPLFQQPFTDVQQVQLRAQIFVYGSIIQGTAPDESCMVAAFGESDCGRTAWEHVWRVTVERLHNQKSPLSNAKTPLHQNTVARVTEAMRQTVHRSEAVCTPAGVDSHKLSSAVFSPNMPISSPIWSVSAACRDGLLSSSMPRGPLFDSPKTLLPLQPYQSPQVRHFVGNTSPWMAQMPSPGTWVVTPQTAAVDASVHHPTLPMSETVRVTAVRESSVPHHSSKQKSHPSPLVHSSGPPSGPAGRSQAMDAKKTILSPAKHTAESKPRKKRKNMAPEEPGQISSLVQPWRDPVSFTAQSPTSVSKTTITSTMNVISLITAHSPTAVATTTRTSGVNVASGSLLSGSSPVSFTHHQILGGGETKMRATPSEEMCVRIEQAKKQADDAAALATTAVRHCQSIWSQLATQKKSGVVSDLAAKLESSAVAIAAAASVAKAAAAVAKVASDAALQAKLMADEALGTSENGNLAPGTSYHDDVKNIGRVTPSSILKGREQTQNADSALVAVREAARKRVEAASAAAKRAENLNAVLKAAEMTAEAVSQAGTIIAMGEPLPFSLSELVDAGPEGYWKLQQKSYEQILKHNNAHTELTRNVGTKEAIGHSEQLNEQLVNEKETNQNVELYKDSAENRMLAVNGLQQGSVSSSGVELEARKGCTDCDFSKTEGVIPESQADNTCITVQDDRQQLVRTLNDSSIQEGSLVEVRSDEDGLRMVWFSAKVLSLKDGKAFVSYTEHASHEGSSQPTELVPLDDKGGNAPRVRISHPVTSTKCEGTKKRSRGARGDYTWRVGDKVDAWIRNGWWEGTVTGKSKEDETNLTVHFLAQNETSVVRAWNLRPSLIWEDGKWIEWCHSMESNSLSHEGDTPHGKPPKKSRIEVEIDPAVEAREKDKMTKLPTITELRKPEAPKPLLLSAKEKVFNVGKKATEKVIFGVPKPGKKRKFMDVSKHYVSGKEGKSTEGTDSVKFAKFLMPQDSASGWKASSKVVSKGKRIAESKPTMLKSGKSQGVSSKDTSGKEGVSTPALASLNRGKISKNNKTSEGPALSSKLEVASDSQSSKKSSSDVTADMQSHRGEATPSGDKLVRNIERGTGHGFGNSIPNAVEPRRSNRRIQPTSRLLEGLQSSLTVSKIPSASHDKGIKAQQRSTRGRNHG